MFTRSRLVFGLALSVAGLVSSVAWAQDTSSTTTKTEKVESPKQTPGNADAPKPDETETKPSTDTSKEAKPKKSPFEVATFGGGCFWSIEAVFERIKGVQAVTSGFSGGSVANPSYQQVGTGMTGHAEVVQIVYDSRIVSYETLLKIFWKAHDPTTLNAQGDDYGTQYRSIILYHDEEQRLAAIKVYKELKAKRVYRGTIVTQLVPYRAFFPAEAYHQDYFRMHPDSDYSQIYIIPKIWKMKLK